MTKSDNKRKRTIDLYKVINELPEEMLEIKTKSDDKDIVESESQNNIFIFNKSKSKRSLTIKIAAVAIAVAAAICITIGITNHKNENVGNESGNPNEDVVNQNDTEIEQYVNKLRKWDVNGIREVTNCEFFDYNEDGWNQIEGTVSYEIMKESNYCGSKQKLVNIIFDIENPGNTALKKGTNERYVYFYDFESQGSWMASKICTEDEIDYYSLEAIQDKNSYQEEDGTTQAYFTEKGIAFNGGLGYGKIEVENGLKDACIVPCGQDVNVDLNGDSKDEVLNIKKLVAESDEKDEFFETKGVFVDGKEKSIRYKSKYPSEYYYVVDLNPNDKYIEIAFLDESWSHSAIIYRYDGNKFSVLEEVYDLMAPESEGGYDYYGKNSGNYDDLGFEPFINIKLGDNWIDNKCYTITEDGLMVSDVWYITNPEITTDADITVYEDMDLKSKKENLSKGSKIKIVNILNTDNIVNEEVQSSVNGINIWAEIEKEDKTKVYIHILDYNTFENNGEKMDRFDLYSGWTDREKRVPFKQEIK